MKKLLKRIAVILGSLLGLGAATALVWFLYAPGPFPQLETADQIILFSLEPNRYQRVTEEGDIKTVPVRPELPRFYDYPVLGRVVVTDAGEVARVRRSINRATRLSTGIVFQCFIPRHGLRIETKAGTWDLVICFECGRIYEHYDRSEKGHLTPTASGPEDTINKLFRKAGVEITKN